MMSIMASMGQRRTGTHAQAPTLLHGADRQCCLHCWHCIGLPGCMPNPCLQSLQCNLPSAPQPPPCLHPGHRCAPQTSALLCCPGAPHVQHARSPSTGEHCRQAGAHSTAHAVQIDQQGKETQRCNMRYRQLMRGNARHRVGTQVQISSLKLRGD